jgi:hypothetical protein
MTSQDVIHSLSIPDFRVKQEGPLTRCTRVFIWRLRQRPRSTSRLLVARPLELVAGQSGLATNSRPGLPESAFG